MPRVKTQHGVTLYYESVGEGPPMIFHSHHHRGWMYAQVPYFSRYFQTIAYDRRGTGRSDCPTGEWDASDLSLDCVGLMDCLGLEKAVVVGASTGGLMTMQFGLDYPDRAAALIATNFTWWNWSLLQTEHFGPILQAAEQGATLEEMLDAMGRTTVRSWEWEMAPPKMFGADFERSPFLSLLTESGAMSLGTSAEAVRALINLNATWDLRPRVGELEKLQVPTLIMAGDSEPTLLIGNSWELYKTIPGAEFALLKGHHQSRFEQAVHYNSEIRRFLDRHGLLPSPAE